MSSNSCPATPPNQPEPNEGAPHARPRHHHGAPGHHHLRPDLPHTTPALLAAPGFRSHAAHADHEGTFTVTEIWDTREDHRAFFDANVAPNLPPGVTSTVIDLRNAITA